MTPSREAPRSVTGGRPGTFQLQLIKPSHYDDDGYVIQWWRGSVPSNSLSTLYGLAEDARRRRVLGDDVRIELEVRDESTEVLPLRRIIRAFERNQLHGLVCLVGVQTNQFPRAMDIARPLRAAGIQVAIGGFHVSGSLAMLPELLPDVREAQELGICLFAGEAEGRMDELLHAAAERRLPPIYNFMADLPGLEAQALPALPASNVRRYLGNIASFDAGRGCPFSCSFCTIINVQGRKSRFRTADDVEMLIRAGAAQGFKSYFITDDNFARNKNWEAILDRIIELRRDHGFKIHLNMQVDTCCHKLPNFIEKAARAGTTKVFIGLENINPANLKEASKGQNQITEYRAMLQAWRRHKVLTFAGYILGFAHDTPESIAHDIEVIQRELPIDMLEFFILTPLPGSKDHQELFRNGTPMDADMNKYDSEHVVTAHPHMSAAQWTRAYERAWHQYYSPAHIETLLRRAMAGGASPRRVAEAAFFFFAAAVFERVHPLQSGLFRRKARRQRRSGMPRESLLAFGARRVRDVVGTYVPMLRLLWRIDRLRRGIQREPNARAYSDLAIAPARGAAADDLELFRQTAAARTAAEWARSKRVAAPAQ
ncbi:MAG: radical SAM protein [Deltaproteobacteria bacterium]|nr:radical SAM protein [Deltaproteobacteria bacterium]